MRGRLLRLWGGLPIPGRVRWWMVLAGTAKFPISVTAVIADEAGRLLMFRHTYRGRYPWGLPAGWLKPGEKPEAGVVREIREETGLEARDPELLLAVGGEKYRRLDLVYRAVLGGGLFRPSPEVTEMRWFGRDELPPMMEDQYDMIRAILEVLDHKP